MKKIHTDNNLLARKTLGVATAILGIQLSLPVWAGASFTTFNHYIDGYSGSVSAVSGDGSVVVGSRGKKYSTEAFRWTATEGVVDLGHLLNNWQFSAAADVTADGSVIVGVDVGEAGYGGSFRWTAATGMVRLDSASGVPDASTASVRTVSANGAAILGNITDNFGINQPFRWTSSTGIQVLPGLDFATNISADGKVVAGIKYTSYPLYTQVYRQIAGGALESLGDLPDSIGYTFPTAISTDGSVIVGHSTTNLGPEAFYWSQSTGMVGLGDLPGGDYFSVANSVSGDGKLVVGVATPEGMNAGTEPFIWSARTGMQPLKDLMIAEGVDLTNLTLRSAVDISQDGSTIVGEVANYSLFTVMGYVFHITDFDHDGYNKPADCNDTDPTVYPKAPETKLDGIDQDCNGYDLTINITQAAYFATAHRLIVSATSSLGSAAKLSTAEFGPMRWNETLQTWNLVMDNVASAPTKITIVGTEGRSTSPIMAR